MWPVVSIIVPVYQVEAYLERCLESLRRQSLNEIEIILVDDASTDGSRKICDAYATYDFRFKVFQHKVNRGLSAARNTGIQKANCEFIMFVDSDDWVHEDFCKAAYECAILNQADLVLFRHQNLGTTKNRIITASVKGKSRPKEGFKTRTEAMDLLFDELGQAAWNKLYRKKLFNNIYYPIGYLSEDHGTTYKTIWQATRIFFLDRVLYYYCIREGSIMSQKTKKHELDLLELDILQYKNLAKWGYPQVKLDLRIQNNAITYCIQKKADISDPRYVFYSNELRSMRLLNVVHKGFTWKRKVLIILYKFLPWAFEVLCQALGRKEI